MEQHGKLIGRVKLAHRKEAEETDGEPAGKAEDIDSESFGIHTKPLNSEPEDIPASASKRPILRHGKVHGDNQWIAETAPEEGRERDDGSGGTVAPGTLSLADMHRERENPPDG